MEDSEIPGYDAVSAESAVDDSYRLAEDLRQYDESLADSIEDSLEDIEALPYSINSGDFSEKTLDRAVDGFRQLADVAGNAENFVTDSGVHVGNAYSAINRPDRISVRHVSVMMRELGDMKQVEEVENAVGDLREMYDTFETLYDETLRPVVDKLDEDLEVEDIETSFREGL